MNNREIPRGVDAFLAQSGWVRHLAQHLVTDPSLGEDVAQQAMMVAIGCRPSVADPRSWLNRLVRNTAWELNRSEKRRRRHEQQAPLPEASESPEDLVEQAELQRRIGGAVLGLEEPYRSTLLQRYFRDRTAEQIAEREGIPAATVRSRLKRGLDQLRHRFGGEQSANRGVWLALVLPAVHLESATAAATTGLTVGGIVMSVKTVISALTVTALAAAAIVVGTWDNEPAALVAEESSTAAGAAPLATAMASLPSADEAQAAERVVVPAAEALPGALYKVFDPEGQTVPAANLALCAGGEVLAAGTTDGSGRFATELDRDGEARLLVSAEGWAPQVHPVPITAARHEVVLTEGEIVSGWVVVDGHAPDEPISMLLDADRGYGDPLEDLGVEMDALALSVSTPLRARTRTAANGAFRCAGLPAGWSGRIDLPSEYRLRDQIDAASDYSLSSVRLERAVEGLRMDVVRRPVLAGRVVDQPEGSVEPVPVAGVYVRPYLTYAEGTGGTDFQSWGRTDEDGRFRIPLLALSIRGGSLTLEPQSGGFWRSIAIEPLELTGDHDLGDLALVDLEGKVTVPLLVHSTKGEPIAGAVAGTDRESPISEPTDELGSTTLRGVIPVASTIVVYATGFEVTSVDVPREPADELVVTMRRAAMLELRFRQPNGEPAGRVIARLWSDVHPYRDETPIALIEGYRAAGCTWYQTVRPRDGTVVARLHAGREGRAVASDVRPGVALHLRVEGRFGATVLEMDLAPLAPADWKVVDVDLPRGPLTLHGRVVDEAGAPVPSARYGVSFTAPDSPAGSMMSTVTGVDENGEFHFRDIYQPRIHLSIEADGYVELSDREFEVPLDEEPVVFVLAAGRIVTVILQDEQGRPVEGSVNSFLPGGAYSFGRAVVDQPGTYLLRGLPAHEVTIRAIVHDVVYKQKHHPQVPTVTFTVPTYEDVTVKLVASGTVALDALCFLRLLPLDDANPYSRYHRLARSSGSFTIESVVPGRYEAVVSRYFSGIDEQSQYADLCARVPFVVAPEGPTSVTVEY